MQYNFITTTAATTAATTTIVLCIKRRFSKLFNLKLVDVKKTKQN